jgi:hypothetical protein
MGDSDNESADYEPGAMEADDELDLPTIDIPGIKPELRKLYAQHPELALQNLPELFALLDM